MGKVRAELVTPPPDRFVADDHAALEEQLFDIPQAQLKSEIPAHRATDDGVWKTMAVVKGLGCLHRSTLPASIVTVTMPLADIPDLILRRYARRLVSRPPSAGAKIKEPARTVEVACFLRYCLFTTTDQLILMSPRNTMPVYRYPARLPLS
jgi:hypothetical protein